ncbi:MAG: prepilin-type N-terminal cleavage/methylation domain-containing protein [Tepidisphaeraceae bacterium]
MDAIAPRFKQPLRKASRRPRYRGTSLVEFLVVLTIMLLVLGFVLPAASMLYKAARSLGH